MQTYPLKLSPTAQTLTFNTAADLFVYESGDAGQGGDARICVKPDNGSEIILRPGQRFRVTAQSQRWSVKLNDPAATLSGAIIIGSGEFDDANTLNSVKLDASFANNVTVMNGAGNRVQVSIDPAQVTQITQQQGPVMAYTNALTMQILGASIGTLIPPAGNVNGIIIEQLKCQSIGAIMAKAAQPGNIYDGDMISLGDIPTGTRIKIAAGKGLYGYATTASTGTVYMLYTVL